MNHPIKIYSILPAILLSTLLLSGCGGIRESLNPGPAATASRRIEVQPDHRACSTAADCVMVQVDCSGCSCGAAIPKEYLDDYRGRYTEHCETYSSPVCDFYPPIEELVCRAGQSHRSSRPVHLIPRALAKNKIIG